MGASHAPGTPNRQTNDLFYGDGSPLKLQNGLKGRRGLPGGPILPKLPPNPFATKARRIGKSLNLPAMLRK